MAGIIGSILRLTVSNWSEDAAEVQS
jgi:hypothetical protein